MAGKRLSISGTWRETSPEVEQDVRATVRTFFEDGDSLVVGGALGVDYFSIDEMFSLDPSGERITIILPTSLFHYIGRLTAWASGQDDTAKARVTALITLLERLRAARPEALEEMADIAPEDIVEDDYLACNNRIIELSDGLFAFQVNDSTGTQDAIDKMRAAGKPVTVHEYSL